MPSFSESKCWVENNQDHREHQPHKHQFNSIHFRIHSTLSEDPVNSVIKDLILSCQTFISSYQLQNITRQTSGKMHGLSKQSRNVHSEATSVPGASRHSLLPAPNQASCF